MSAALQYADSFVQQLAQDETQKDVVKASGDAMGKAENEVKGMAQRQQAAQKAQQSNGGDPKDAAKAQAIVMMAQTKNKITEERSARRQAQDQLKFEQKLEQDKQKHALNLQAEAAHTSLELAKGRQKLFDE